MATINGIQVALDVDLATQTLFEPEPFFIFDPIVVTESEVIFPVESLDGRDWFLQGKFQLLSPTELLFTDLFLLNTDFTIAGSATDLDIVVTATTDLNAVVFDALSGPDVFDGSENPDFAVGFFGNDLFIGRGGPDFFAGDQGNDVLYGNLGDDFLSGGQDLDRIFGGQGSDVIYGNLQDDVVYGNLGNDFMFGGQGQDVLYGGQNDDVLLGNRGDDTLIGNKGNDDLWGGPDADSFVFGPGSGFDTIVDFEIGLDEIIIQGTGATVSQSGANVIVALDSGDSVTVENSLVSEVEADLFFA